MAIRLLASYEFIGKDGNPAGMVRLPVVDYERLLPNAIVTNLTRLTT